MIERNTSTHQGWIYMIKNTVKTVMLWNIITIQNNCFYFNIFKLSRYSSLQCHVIVDC